MTDGRDLDWDEAMATAGYAACVPVKSEDPAYILYMHLGPPERRKVWCGPRLGISLH